LREVAHLEDYALHTIFIQARQEQRWQFNVDDFAVLLDPKVKALCVVNPGNPYAVALSSDSIARIGRVLQKRPDLMLLTDDVYGTFVPGFRSLLGEFPRNTIGVYSFSKYFGCSGWRLGVIAVHEKNVFDATLAAQPENVRHTVEARYAPLTLTPGARWGTCCWPWGEQSSSRLLKWRQPSPLFVAAAYRPKALQTRFTRSRCPRERWEKSSKLRGIASES
jgi:histidinol-phosphate/aromatic aminotransferase/cobyric acid decarboxylase-like protein